MGLSTGKCECFLCSPKRPVGPCVPQSLLVIMYWISSPEIKRPGPDPNNSPPPSAEVMMLSTVFPLVLRSQLNEQQKVKIVRVSGTDRYCKQWACDIADWYKAVGEG
jgi:hypothetical protein